MPKVNFSCPALSYNNNTDAALGYSSHSDNDKFKHQSARSIFADGDEIISDVRVLIAEHKHEDAIHRLFHYLNFDGNGVLSRNEFLAFFQEACHTVHVEVEDQILHLAISKLIEDGTGNPDTEAITPTQFFSIFRQHPELYWMFEDDKQQKFRSRSQRITLPEPDQMQGQMTENEFHLQRQGILYKHVWKRIDRVGMFNVVLFAVVTVGCFIVFLERIFERRNSDLYALFSNTLLLAAAPGMVVNYTVALAFIPITRLTMTWTRGALGNRFNTLLSSDALLALHIYLGLLTYGFAIIHTLAHLGNYARFARASDEEFALYFGALFPDGDIPRTKAERWGWLLKHRATISGILMLICMGWAGVYLGSRRTKFNQFWYSHHLLILMALLMCVHGTANLIRKFQSVYWVVIPMLLYLVPRLYREFNRASSKILRVALHDDALGLRLEKPRNWSNRQEAGMYALINIPKLSRSEWHPFTLSSCPADNFIEFHIKAAGDWTKRLHELINDLTDNKGEEVELGNKLYQSFHFNEADQLKDGDGQPMVVRVEGPFGAPAQHHDKFKVVVLVGAGIGITPMISVVKQLLASPGEVKKALFYWSVRDQHNFQMFESVMETVYEEDKNNILEMRNFLTSAKDNRDFRSVLLHYAANMMHKDTNVDMFLGGRKTTRLVQVGRPKWKEELERVYQLTSGMGQNECGIFLCGPMSAAVRDAAEDLMQHHEGFKFNLLKETF